jgi:hypothetical protein
MLAERMAAVAMLAEAQAFARTDAHRCNLEAAMAEADQCFAKADRTEGLASVAA